MPQRFLSKVPAFIAVGLVLITTVFYLWQSNQPQPVPDLDRSDGLLQCVSYSPYYKAGMDPTVAGTFVDPLQIVQDLQAISKIAQCVRIYSVSQGMDYVPEAAQKIGLKVILGSWVGWFDDVNKAELALAVQRANQFPDTVESIVVGNEVLLRGEQSEAKVREYLQWAKAHTKAPVTYADVWEFWLKHPTLEQDVDFVTVHILPYWEDLPVAIELAVSHTASVMGQLGQSFKKPILIGETGWPSKGRQRFRAQPGQVNQARYIRDFLKVAKSSGWRYNVIESFDQPWKRKLEGTVGGYWGMMDTDLKSKFSFTGPVAERHDGWTPYLFALLVAVMAGGWSMAVRRPVSQSLLLVMLLAGWGLHAYLQWDYIDTAARDRLEYIMLGGLMLLGFLIACIQMLPHFGLHAYKHIEKYLLILFALSFFLTSASLAVDGRYRNFPFVLVLWPMAITMIAIFSSNLLSEKEPSAGRHSVWLLSVMVMLATNLAIVVAILEPGNMIAWYWAAICTMAACVLPIRVMQL